MTADVCASYGAKLGSTEREAVVTFMHNSRTKHRMLLRGVICEPAR